MGRSWVKRILLRLEKAEEREPDPQLQEDYRIAWITVLYASQGYAEPHVAAFYQVLGIHPKKYFHAKSELRRAKLGREFATFFPELADPGAVERMLTEHPPKKPPQSVQEYEKQRGDDDALENKRRG